MQQLLLLHSDTGMRERPTRYAAHFALILYGNLSVGSAEGLGAKKEWFIMWMVINSVFAVSVLNNKAKTD